jgi:hypothetical protein
MTAQKFFVPIKPTVGRTVLYVLGEGSNLGQIRPAIIVRVWSDNCVQLQIFTDGENDQLPNVHWATSVLYNPDGFTMRTWHWMDYQLGQAAKTEKTLKDMARPIPVVGQLVTFFAGGTELSAEITHVWSADCVNLELADGSKPTSVMHGRYFDGQPVAGWYWRELI